MSTDYATSANDPSTVQTRYGTPETSAPIEHHCEMFSEYLGGTRVVRVIGRLDWVSAPQLRDLLRDHCSDHAVIVDLGATSSIDAVGVGILLAATARLRHRDQRMAVVVTDPFMTGVLCSTGLEIAVPVVDTVSEAAARLAAMPGS